MPRIRSIRPEFWTRRKLAASAPAVRLVMIGLIQLADDEGRLEGDPVIVRSQLFPAGGITQPEFERAVEFLAAAGEIVLYEVDGSPYVALPGWRDKDSWQFQHISKRQRSRLPAPPEDSEDLPEPPPEDSGSVPGTFREPSGTTPSGSREQGTGSRESPSPPSPAGEGGGAVDSPDEATADAPFTAGERAAAAVVAEAIERGDVRLDPDDEQRGVDRDITGADAAKRDATRARDGNALAAAEKRIDELNRRRRELVEQRRAAAAALLRSGAPDARPLLERWQASDVLVGAKEYRVPLRVACNAARDAARADARDRRRDAKDRGEAT